MGPYYNLRNYTPSKQGMGYQFRPGAPRNRAWVIASVGLPDFRTLRVSWEPIQWSCFSFFARSNLGHIGQESRVESEI
jgi:hypothetical protein